MVRLDVDVAAEEADPRVEVGVGVARVLAEEVPACEDARRHVLLRTVCHQQARVVMILDEKSVRRGALV